MPLLRRSRAVSCATYAALVSLAAGCYSPVESDDPRACQQTSEFGNTGCFEVEGQVVGLRGQSLGGILISSRAVVVHEQFSSGSQSTDAKGRFTIRLMRMFGKPPANSAPDTLSVYVHAVDPRSAGAGVPATVRDSVLTFVTMAPIGALPQTATVQIVLPVP